MKILNQLIALTFAFSFAVDAEATQTTLIGTSFDLIYDTSLTGLFGAPILSGNTVFFTPINYKAESLNGNGVVSANSTVSLELIAKNGNVFDNFALVESGDYKLIGAGSAVSVGGQTRVLDGANPLNNAVASIISTDNFGIFNSSIVDPTTHNWNSNSNISLLDPKFDHTTHVFYTIENLLTAYTEPSTVGPRQAFIEKKFAGSAISLIVTAVPEPETYAMMMIGLGLISVVRRKSTLV